VQLITICAVVKSKCSIEKVSDELRSAEILVKAMIYMYAPITWFCVVIGLNPA